MTVLETPRLRLRELVAGDADNLLEIFSDPVAMAFYPSTKTREEAEAWIRWARASYERHGFGLWAIERIADGRFVGDCGPMLQPVEGETVPEIGYHVVRTEWGKGYASEAALAVRDWLFRDTAWRRCVSIVDPANVASRRVAERVHDLMRMFRWEKVPGREMCLYETVRNPG